MAAIRLAVIGEDQEPQGAEVGVIMVRSVDYVDKTKVDARLRGQRQILGKIGQIWVEYREICGIPLLQRLCHTLNQYYYLRRCRLRNASPQKCRGTHGVRSRTPFKHKVLEGAFHFCQWTAETAIPQTPFGQYEPLRPVQSEITEMTIPQAFQKIAISMSNRLKP